MQLCLLLQVITHMIFNDIAPTSKKVFITDYVPDLGNRVHEQHVKKQAMMQIYLNKFQKDSQNDKNRKKIDKT